LHFSKFHERFVRRLERITIRIRTTGRRLGTDIWKLMAGSWMLSAGSWQLVAGSCKLAAGSWQLLAGSWQLVAVSWKLVAGGWKLPFAPSLLLRRRRLFQNARPIELDVRIVLLEQVNRVFVNRRAADTDAGRRAEKIQETLLPSTAACASARQKGGGFVAALVPREAKMGQNLFPLAGRFLLACGR
jgi:hypothetical protein